MWTGRRHASATLWGMEDNCGNRGGRPTAWGGLTLEGEERINRHVDQEAGRLRHTVGAAQMCGGYFAGLRTERVGHSNYFYWAALRASRSTGSKASA